MNETARLGISTNAPVKFERTTADEPAGNHPLRIALIAPPYFEVPPAAYGGVEAVLNDLANGLVELGHEVTLFGCGQAGTQANFHTVWEEPITARLGEPESEFIYAATVRRCVERVAATAGLDLVHDHTGGGPLNATAYSALGLPTVATVHGQVDNQMRGYYEALGADVSLVAISRRQRQLAPQLNWVATVHNGLQPRDWPFSAQKEDYCLFLGRFHPNKGPHTALDAVHEADVSLILAGKCSEAVEREYFASVIEPMLRPTDKVVGVADAVAKRRLLSRARCLVFPIQWEEPFGMVMIEAMICGTPVIALRRGAVPEVLVNGVTGFICDDPAELPDAIRSAASIDPYACRNHVIESFSAASMANGYTSAYRQLISRHSAGRAATRTGHPDSELRQWTRRLTRTEGATTSGPGL